jgi:predicted MFS family arabinose efflux permease
MKMTKNIMLLFGLIGGLGVASTDVYVSILPKLADLYEISPYHMNLTLTVYFFMTGLGSLLFLKLGRQYSAHTIYLFSFLLFIFGGLFIALNQYYPLILIGRSIQGLGIGLLQANLISFIRTIEPKKFSINMAIFSQSGEFQTLFFPILGIFLFEKLGWNVPFLFTSIFALFLMLKSKSIVQKFERNNLDVTQNEFDSSQKHRLLSDKNFLICGAVFVLINAIGWGLISISPYILENNLLGDWGHGFFYFFYTGIYIVGSYVFEKLEHFCKMKLQRYSMILMLICGTCLILSTLVESHILFIVSMFVFGFLSGLLYGFILDKAHHNIHQENNRNSRLVTTTMLVSRLVGSAIFTASLSWMYSQDEKMAILFCGSTMVFISYLLLLGRKESTYKISG